jgi:hypothetical protein
MTDRRYQSILFVSLYTFFLFALNGFALAGVVVLPLGDDLYVVPVNPENGNEEILPDCLVLGDSIGAATHANDACDRALGDHRELMDCLDLRLGSHDPAWSYMGGTKEWSIASRLCSGNVYNTSRDGDEWKDALDRSRDLMQTGQIGKVIVNLGSNDVCAKYNHDFGSLAFVQPTTPGNTVSIEAEHYIQKFPGSNHQWQPDNSPGASIGAVRALPDDGTVIASPDYLIASPRLDYRVNFVRSGLHYVWIRGYATDSGDNLLHIGLNGLKQPSAESMEIEQYNKWIWSGTTENGAFAFLNIPSTGIHTLNIYMQKDGLRLDKIVMVPDKQWVPSGAGPFESARGIFKQDDLPGSGIVAIEAEHFHHLKKSGFHNWVPDYQAGYSGGAALRALPNHGTSYGDDLDAAPRLDFTVQFDSPGTYYVWVRGYAMGNGDDSVHVGVDGINSGSADKIKLNSHGMWTWSNTTMDDAAATIDISDAGIRTINIWMHMDGFRLDKILLSGNPSYQPSNYGPEEKWENDLGRIAGHIDDTMMYLTENLPQSGEIYWSGITDISKFRDLMVNRKHDHAFKKCQYLWDMDITDDTLQGDAKNSLCIGEIGNLCILLPGDIKDDLLGSYLDEFQEDFDGDKPCGRVLDSRNTQQDRDEARRFNKSLNDLMEQKAAQYRGRQSVDINYTQTLWYQSDAMRPYFISRIDCYHPNRLGQMKLAQMVWQGHDPNFPPTDIFFYEGFDSDDWCTQEFTSWSSCWYDGGGGDCGDEFICNIDNSGWFKFGKETFKDKDHWISRDVGDLSDKSEVWAYFKHKRDNFDGIDADWVAFYVWNGSSWVRVEKFKKYNDAGNHCSQYYDLTPYKNAVPLKIRFLTNDSMFMNDGDKLMLDDFSIFAW